VKIGNDAGRPPAQVALNWLIQKHEVTCVLTGARTIAQLKENLGSLEWQLGEEQITLLDAASDEGTPYPYDFIARYTRA
jgi:aryl-alcohol dehydrogenase-like predicted oxidoreductase